MSLGSLTEHSAEYACSLLGSALLACGNAYEIAGLKSEAAYNFILYVSKEL